MHVLRIRKKRAWAYVDAWTQVGIVGTWAVWAHIESPYFHRIIHSDSLVSDRVRSTTVSRSFSHSVRRSPSYVRVRALQSFEYSIRVFLFDSGGFRAPLSESVSRHAVDSQRLFRFPGSFRRGVAVVFASACHWHTALRFCFLLDARSFSLLVLSWPNFSARANLFLRSNSATLLFPL